MNIYIFVDKGEIIKSTCITEKKVKKSECKLVMILSAKDVLINELFNDVKLKQKFSLTDV